ncbi:lipoprotein LpqH [Mycobacterium sp. SMC-4]|uniref:lipoprotein LpqH n=1 Tax=Mycobacterium sp. SMC-4 TaxID=2857059 RepID=UPI0021B3D311|nr:lipoprotein LpqH [Mycobacterium sp. SMC-4]UXA17807.1 lipoprotein LpqH [Mycobacterium sp. SMC-4]
MKRSVFVAISGAALIVAGLSGCSSNGEKSETTGETSAVASAEGKSTVTIDGEDQEVAGTVTCATMGGNINIAMGDPAGGLGAVLTEGDPPSVVSVALGNVNGMNLGYAANAGQGEATVEKDGDTYKITGTATGMDMANPMQPVNKPFEIEVTCP